MDVGGSLFNFSFRKEKKVGKENISSVLLFPMTIRNKLNKTSQNPHLKYEEPGIPGSMPNHSES